MTRKPQNGGATVFETCYVLQARLRNNKIVHSLVRQWLVAVYLFFSFFAFLLFAQFPNFTPMKMFQCVWPVTHVL
jgi:hypothetical protein